MALRLNPLTGEFDLVGNSVVNDNTTAPTGKADAYVSVVSDGGTNAWLYFFANGHRFKVVGTLDDPTNVNGSPIGLLLALTYGTSSSSTLGSPIGLLLALTSAT